MVSSTVIASRFELLGKAASGGMSTIFRARDLQYNTAVALKVLHSYEALDIAAMNREIEVLSHLRSPLIIGYAGSGTFDNQGTETPFIALEWLDGEDLASVVRRTRLEVNDTIALMYYLCEALNVVHTAGWLHLDLKPNNVFLRDKNLNNITLLDFGIAQRIETAKGPREGEATAGTLGYMAPEQLSGGRILTPRADIYALGCVAFKCLTGRRPFEGDHSSAIMARTLFDVAPRISTVRPDIPEPLDDLIACMLATDPADRPGSVQEVAHALYGLRSHKPIVEITESYRSKAITGVEQQLVSVIVLAASGDSARASRPPDVEAQLLRGTPSTTLSDEERTERFTSGLTSAIELAVRSAIAPFHARVEWLVDGTIVVVVTSDQAATDLATRSARCALALRSALPETMIGLATGRAILGEKHPMGEVIDRAINLLRPTGIRLTDDASFIRLDEVTAGLLSAEFDVSGDTAGLTLRGQRDHIGMSARTLLNRSTPCVGRERELGQLASIFDECVRKQIARAVLVTGSAGSGKSRIRMEFLRRVALRRSAVEVWFGRGDVVRPGSPFEVVGSALRQAIGIAIDEPLLVRQQKLRARLGRYLSSGTLNRVSEFLGEMIDTPFADNESPQLRSARADIALRGDQIRRAWEDWLAAEARQTPVIFMIEDLQAGDLPSIHLIDSALRNLANLPWMVVAFARPEVLSTFPSLWQERSASHIQVGELSPSAARQLVRAVLGNAVDGETVQRLIDLSAGNAFCLEELIRFAVSGNITELPPTVLAIAQARIETLAPDGRRILRAASIMGTVFWADSVRVLLGGTRAPGNLDQWLEELCNQEFLISNPVSRYSGHKEYTFRQEILRESAYSSLTEQDRILGHKIAAAWLERVGEQNAFILAEHYEHGREPKRAAGFYLRAAEQSLEGNDLTAVTERAQKAIACGASGVQLGRLNLIQAEAHKWRGVHSEAERFAGDAMKQLPVGGAYWYNAAVEHALSSSVPAVWTRHAEELLRTLPDTQMPGATAAYVGALARLALRLSNMRVVGVSEQLFAQINAFMTEEVWADPVVTARISIAKAADAHHRGDSIGNLTLIESGLADFERAGAIRHACAFRVEYARAHFELGSYKAADRTLRVSIQEAEQLGLPFVVASAKTHWSRVLIPLGAVTKAKLIAREAVEAFTRLGHARMIGVARTNLAIVLLELGDLTHAEMEARSAIEKLASIAPLKLYALAVLAQVLLRQRRANEALDVATQAAEQFDSLGGTGDGESFVRLVMAESLVATGQYDEAKLSITIARDRVYVRASLISDVIMRASFLENVPENVRTLALAEAWTSV